MLDACNNVLKTGLATDLNFHFYGYLVNNTRASLDYPTGKKQQHGGKYRLSVDSGRNLMPLPITIVSVIYIVHPSTPTQIQSKHCMRTCNLFSWGGCWDSELTDFDLIFLP